MSTIDKLICNSPYYAPSVHWKNTALHEYARLDGRRKAGFMRATKELTKLGLGTFVEIPVVNELRDRVDVWRKAHYPFTTTTTKLTTNCITSFRPNSCRVCDKAKY
jgi:type III restriction enzyme